MWAFHRTEIWAKMGKSVFKTAQKQKLFKSLSESIRKKKQKKSSDEKKVKARSWGTGKGDGCL